MKSLIKKFNCFGSKISAVKMTDLESIFTTNNYHIPKYICCSTVHSIIEGLKDPHFQMATNNSWISIPDGKPLSVYGNIKYKKKTLERIHAHDLMEFVLNNSVRFNLTNYFYGSTIETLKKLKDKLPDNPKYLKEFFSPPFKELSQEEIQSHFDHINKIKPHIIWIGLGNPKQEKFMLNHLNKLDFGIMVGVGAVFDYMAGNIKRAPDWMQKCSLEWFFRLLQEPRRLWKRYLVTNTIFLYKVAGEIFSSLFLSKKK